MSVGEIQARIFHFIKLKICRLGLFLTSSAPSPDLNQKFNPWIQEKTSQLDRSVYRQAADRILDQGVRFFVVEKKYDEIIKDWNRDPKTGTRAPLSFGPGLNYNDADKVGDIKYLWEPNRHLFLVTLAQAYSLSGEKRYLHSIGSALTSWLDQCPFMYGPNWSSSLELGIRLINWSIIWQLIGGLKSDLFQGSAGRNILNRWIESIYRHVQFVENNLSFYSSANNHLIGEIAGLFISTVTWPFWPRSKYVSKKAMRLLEREVLLQNASDGTNREQALAYQQFVLDFMIMAGLAANANGYSFSNDYWQRIERMLEFIASMIDVSGNVPMIGDADDGYVSYLSPEEDFCNFNSLIATGAALFNRKDLKAKVHKLDQKTCWLLGERAAEIFSVPNPPSVELPIRRFFDQGGYYILGKNFETKNEIRCLVYCGPLGYLSIAAHGHAAALSIYLSIGGREILIDPGTYVYHGNDRWRDYFRGTSSHCTVGIDGSDQSQSGGKFMWTKHANSNCELWEIGKNADRFRGYHDGYLYLKDPVIHRREVALDKLNDRITITDIIKCKKKHSIKRFWHFSEDCNVILQNGRLSVLNNGVAAEIYSDNLNQKIQLKRGNEDPLLGWVSRGFDRKSPAFSAVMLNTINGDAKFTTIIDVKELSMA